MIEDQLVQYGVFGLWTVFNIGLIMFLIKRQDAKEQKVVELVSETVKVVSANTEQIKQNTAVLQRASELLQRKR